MKKIKILYFPVANTMGGITQYALTMSRFLDPMQFQADFAAVQKIENPSVFEQNNSHFYQLDCYPAQNRELFREQFLKILDNGYDILHLNTKIWADYTIEQLAKERGIKKVIVHSHATGCVLNMSDELEGYEQKKQFLTQKHYKVRETLSENIATDYWACSKGAADWLFGNKIPADRIEIINNAIDCDKFAYNPDIRQLCRKQLKLENKFVVGNVARLSAEKNQKFLIDIIARINKIDENVVLIIIGDGCMKETLQKRIEEYNLKENVLLLGYQEKTEIYLQAMDVFCLPSVTESFGICLVEAQAAGVPCVVSDAIISEVNILGNMQYCSNEIQEWIDAILSIKQREFDRRNAARIVREQGFDIRTQVKMIEEKYKEGL